MEARGPFSHILVPTDGSETSINAGWLAIQIAAAYRVNITFLYIIDTSVAEQIASATGRPIDAVCQELSNKAQNYLDYLSRLAANQGLPVHQVIRRGTPYLEITDLARDLGVDLIVIGRVSGLGTQRLARIGSVAERVIEYAHCPVLTVRHRPQR